LSAKLVEASHRRAGFTGLNYTWSFDQSKILSFGITPGNDVDRKPVPKRVKNLTGRLFGDRGYISKQLAQMLANQNVTLITTLKKTWKLKPSMVSIAAA
jgi:hypothetical protein